MKRVERSADAPVESDSRFPSGDWRGFYIQRGIKQRMELSLTFRDGRIVGCGIDPVGKFLIRGGYKIINGRAYLLKFYISKHRVNYMGWAEAVDGGIWGTWTIGQVEDRGGWHIWPHCSYETRSQYAQEQQPMRMLEPSFDTLLEAISPVAITG
jgi:hypothetical protein